MVNYTNHCQYLFVNGYRVIFVCLEDKGIMNKQYHFLHWIGNYYWSYSSWKLEQGLKCFQQAKAHFHASSKRPSVSLKPALPPQKHILYICCTTSNTSFRGLQWPKKPLISVLPQSAAQGAGNGAVHSQLHTQLQRDLLSSFQKMLWFWFPFSFEAAFTGRTLKKQAEQEGVCVLAVAQRGQAACTRRSRIPAGARRAALGAGNKAGSSKERVGLALLKSMQIGNKGWSGTELSWPCSGRNKAGNRN